MISTMTLKSARTRVALGESPTYGYHEEMMKTTIDLLDFLLARKSEAVEYSEWTDLVARAIWRQTKRGVMTQGRADGYWSMSFALFEYLKQLDVFVEIRGPKFKTKVFHSCVRDREKRLQTKYAEMWVRGQTSRQRERKHRALRRTP